MALNRTLEHLDNADEAADAAKAKLEKQNERLAKMGGNMDRIQGNLDQTDKQIGHLEDKSGYIGTIVKAKIKNQAGKVNDGVAKVADKVAQTKVAEKLHVDEKLHKVGNKKVDPTLDPGGAPVFSGWLLKRGRQFGENWNKRWIVVCPAAIFVYTNEDCLRVKDAFALFAGAKAYSFRDKDAPGDSIKHRGEKPLGFVVDIGSAPSSADGAAASSAADLPEGGAQEGAKLLDKSPGGGHAGHKPPRRVQQHYFNAQSEEDLRKWLKIVNRVGRRLRVMQKGGAASFDKVEQDQSTFLSAEEKEQLSLIDAKLDHLKDKAKDISDETKKQQELVEDLNAGVDGATTRIKEQDARLKKHINDQ